MKTIKTLTAAALIIGATACTKDKTPASTENLPEQVGSSFSKQNPDVKDVKWEKEGDYFEAEFEVDGKEVEVVYDKDGKVVAKEMEIDASTLPQAINEYIQANFNGSDIEEACEVKQKGETFYMVEIESDDTETELLFDHEGKFLKKEVETDDESGDEDED